MNRKQKISADILSQRELAPGIFELWIGAEFAGEARAGQFVMLYPRDHSTLLPRPISVCEKREGQIRLVYRVAGKGTGEFSGYREGETVQALGPLGNGYDPDTARGKRAVLLGGGIGIPPLLELARELSERNGSLPEAERTDICVIAGYRGAAEGEFLRADLERYARVYVATEDGSSGTRGNVLDALREQEIPADILYSCGPLPMLRAVKRHATMLDIPAYLSLEERMACGVGVCLGCVVKTHQVDAHSHVKNARVCTEGPVFEAREVKI